MICEHCQKEKASVFLTQVVNGQKIELHLCGNCAKEQENLLYGDNSSFQQFLSGLLKTTGAANKVNPLPVQTCPKCNMTLDEFRKHSKVGCDGCYQAFKPYLQHILKSVHGSQEHTGKRPLRLNKTQMLTETVEDLEARLRLALMQEDYALAATLRDELHRIKEVD